LEDLAFFQITASDGGWKSTTVKPPEGKKMRLLWGGQGCEKRSDKGPFNASMFAGEEKLGTTEEEWCV